MQEIWFSGILVIVLFYLILILPQQITGKQRRKDLAQLNVGDQVAMVGGLIGEIVSLNGNELALQIAPDITVRVLRSAVSHKVQST